ncbi:RAD55 family ATPase [Salinirarus marinus]|uniref:RAD55 family ATPase n=1 Tax=Salinirarus marinus TaxID=3068310 RepID=UPI003C6C8AF6
MYDLGPALDLEVDPGTNLLIAGSPLTGKRELALDILATGVSQGEGVIIVTNTDSAERFLQDFGERVPYENNPVAVVDCVTRQQGVSDAIESDRIRYTSSPEDMTGIGIQFSELLQEFYEERNIERNRILLHSLSTLLMYSDLQTVFRFLHVFTGRVQSADGVGLYTIDSTAHDERTLNTLKQLFDGIITTHEDSEPTVNVPGA